MKRKICVITGTRAEYGLMRWVMQGIRDNPELTLQIIATGRLNLASLIARLSKVGFRSTARSKC